MARGTFPGVFSQRYDSAGVPLGSELRVNSFTTGGQGYPSVAGAAEGDFVVVWAGRGQGDSYGIFGQRYDGGGGAQGSEFRVNSYTTSLQYYPSVASDASGNFVVVWTSIDQDGPNGSGIFGQRYDSGGSALGDEFRVNSFTTGYQVGPSVASDASGNFVVAWDEQGQDDDDGIFGQRYNSAGVAQGDEFRVNSYTTGYQFFPSVASDASGNFVVAWHSHEQDGDSFGIFGQRYDIGGMAQGDEFQINTYTFGAQQFPSVGATGTNQFVVAWVSNDQDGSGSGVFGQRFAVLPTLSISDVSAERREPTGRASRNWAVFAVTLSASSAQTVTLDYATANGTAMAPSDYNAKSGTLTLSPGQTSAVIAVRVKEDNVHETDETFFVNLSNPMNATIADGQGVGTILNDDP